MTTLPTPTPTSTSASTPAPASSPTVGPPDPDVRRPAVVPDALAPFVAAGLLVTADVHVATTLTARAGDERPEVVLAAALAVRAPRRQHVCADLAAVHDLIAEVDDPDVARSADLPWPEVDRWRDLLAASPVVAVRDPADLDPPDDAGMATPPLTLAGDRLYLDRSWRDERLVARQLRARARRAVDGVDPAELAGPIAAVFPGAAAPDRQQLAAATAVLRHLAVIAGGPGTGKTTTVARILALVDDRARATGAPLPRIALAAPTGKAAQRLTESLHDAATALAAERGGDDPTVARLRATTATTIHRLLGPRPDSRSRFRHHRGHPLPHDVLVVDETSMVSLALIARLLEATRRDARLVLLGDPEQLASVEAGSVLGDVVGDAVTAPTRSHGVHAALTAAVGPDHLTGIPSVGDVPGIDDAIVVLDRVHRFRADSGIAEVAAAIQRGDEDAVVRGLRTAADIRWIDTEVDTADLDEVRADVIDVAGRALVAAADGDAGTALSGLDELRVLCAHRRGPAGVTGWVTRIERWLVTDVPSADLRGRWYLGRPVLVTENDDRLQLANGDVGITVRGPDGRAAVALPGLDATGPRLLAPARLPTTETVHAMTVHKSQGSQFAHVVLVLPDGRSPLLTRELLYTALTRGRQRATLVGTERAVRVAVRTRAARASGLGDALRVPSAPPVVDGA